MMKEKVIDFLNPFHVVMNKKVFFAFDMTKDQFSVTKEMKKNKLGFSCYL